ncbi:hypothetical protein JOJ86_001902 [Rhodococcus percolatus]|uniref:hypothetical protein n=1 Tax=Rhodococcus opacus TaxID=37919 RepID=UPI00080B0C96|nr:hypothetical protein [Rhodococcus opacus]MBA8958611.1 hypothetical protein [Rhodococcus opacus]MBP2204176.1 hypothetical protein [Rhodococcus opacus]
MTLLQHVPGAHPPTLDAERHVRPQAQGPSRAARVGGVPVAVHENRTVTQPVGVFHTAEMVLLPGSYCRDAGTLSPNGPIRNMRVGARRVLTLYG